MKRANKKQNKRNWFLNQHKKTGSTGSELIIQQQQKEIERLRHELKAKGAKAKKKKKRIKQPKSVAKGGMGTLLVGPDG